MTKLLFLHSARNDSEAVVFNGLTGGEGDFTKIGMIYNMYNKKITHSFGFSTNNLLFSANQDSTFTSGLSGGPVAIAGKYYCTGLVCYPEYLGQPGFKAASPPSAACLASDGSGAVLAPAFPFHLPESGKSFPNKHIRPYVCASHDTSSVLVACGFSDSVMVFNIRTRQARMVAMPGKYLHHIPATQPNNKTRESDNPSVGLYEKLDYYPAANCYLRIARLPYSVPENKKISLYTADHPVYEVAIYDTAFRYKGSALLPDSVDVRQIFYTRSKLLAFNKLRTDQDSTTIYFNEYAINSCDGKCETHLEERASYVSPGLPEWVAHIRKSAGMQQEKIAVLQLPAIYCSFCVNNYVDFNYEQLHAYKDFKLVLTTTTPSEVGLVRELYPPEKLALTLLDSTGAYKHLVNTTFRQTMLCLIENDRVAYLVPINPDDRERVEVCLREFRGEIPIKVLLRYKQ